MDIPDGDHKLTEGAAWIELKQFSIRVHETDEGVVVDVYALGCEDDDCIATTYAFDAEAEEAIAERQARK